MSLLIAVVFISGCVGDETGEVTKVGEITTSTTRLEELNLKVGETAKTSILEVTVLTIKKSDYYTYYSDISEETRVERADEGKVFVLADIEIKNIDDVKQYISSSDLSATDSEGYRYDVGYYLGNDALTYQELYPSQKTKAKVLFEAPEDATGLKIFYDFGDIFSIKLASWEISGPVEKLSSVRSASVAILNVETSWSDYFGGRIGNINYLVTNGGSVPIEPTLDVSIERTGKNIYRETDADSFYGFLGSGEFVDEEIYLYESVEYSDTYTVKVNLRDGDDLTLLDSDTKDVFVG